MSLPGVALRWSLLLLLVVAGCGGDDGGGGLDGADAGADEAGYDLGDGTGAGADDGDGPEDDVPGPDDEIDTGPEPDEDLPPGENEGVDPGQGDAADESGLPDPADPYLEPTAALAAAPDLEPGCTAVATLGGHPAWMHFTRPTAPCTGDGSKDRHILRELIRLIESVPEGGRIDAHIFSITVDRVAKALLDAQRNGVKVYLSTDGQVAHTNDLSRTLYLDLLENKVYCSGNRACIATSKGAISHTKLFAFSHATAPDGSEHDDVVWFGSANQTYASGMKLFNNTVTIYGATGLYKDLRHYLVDLYREKKAADYYKPRSGRGRMMRRPANVYVSPEVDTDLVTHRLDDAKPTSRCKVRVLQASLRDSRLAVIGRLVKMKKGGCDVRVVAHNVGQKARRRLADAGIPVRKNRVHDKVFLVEARFGSSFKYRVYTGSHNMSYSAGRRYDEIFVKLAPETEAKHPVYAAFLAHFEDAWETGKAL